MESREGDFQNQGIDEVECTITEVKRPSSNLKIEEKKNKKSKAAPSSKSRGGANGCLSSRLRLGRVWEGAFLGDGSIQMRTVVYYL